MGEAAGAPAPRFFLPQVLAQNPRQKHVLKQLIEEKSEEIFDRQLAQSKFAKIASENMKEEIFSDLKASLAKSYAQILEINDDSCEELIQKEKDNVIAQANVKFREIQWQVEVVVWQANVKFREIQWQVDEGVVWFCVSSSSAAIQLECYAEAQELDLVSFPCFPPPCIDSSCT